jgi:hypothetical protein
MADQTKVGLVYPDLFAPKLLSGVPFAPAQIRGTVLGILGRLQNEPAIDFRPDMKGYKAGVTPAERLDSLKRLWRWINPHRDHAEIVPLMTAVEAELGTSGVTELADETRRALELIAEQEARRAQQTKDWEERQRVRDLETAQQEQSRLEAAKAAPIVVQPVVQEKVSVMLDKPETASIVEAVAETVPESFEALIDARTECVGVRSALTECPPVTPPHNAQETACAFCGTACEGEGCTEIDGQMVCGTCSKEWGN